MGIRYSDASKATNEFVKRERSPTILQLVLLFIVTFLVSITISLAVSDQTLLSLILILILSGLGWYVIIQIQRNRDLVLATEFQNALFTSALGSNNKFCLIIKDDGTLTYMDHAFHDLFSDFVKLPYRHIDSLLKYGEVSKEESDKIFAAIEHNVNDSIVFTINASDNKPHKIVMSIEPITRPAGYILMRARDFVEERSGTVSSKSSQPSQSINAAKLAPSIIQLFSGIIGTNKSAFITDPQGMLLYITPQLEAQLGYASMEMLNKSLSVQDFIYVGESKPDALQLEDYAGDIIFQKKDSDLIKGYIKQSLVKNSDGKLIGCAAVFTDNNADEILKKKAPVIGGSDAGGNASLLSFIEQSPIAIIHLNANGEIENCNSAFRNLMQDTAKTGVALVELITTASREEAKAVIDKAIAGQIPSDTQTLELTLPNNTEVIASVYFSKITNTSTGTDDLMLHLIDITEQKNLELRFSHSQKMQAVGQLAGGVAHDFNNLLTAMIGFCDLLLMRHPAGDQSFADIMQIKQNANRAANLVRQLLAFSRRQTLQPKVLDLTDVLAELSNLIRRLIGENIELKMIHGRDIGNVRADQGQLEQVLINLAVNGRDAMTDGGTLTIQTSVTTIDKKHPLPRHLIAPAEEDSSIPNGQYILVEVIDTGTGIPKDIVQKIFEPFFSTKEVGSGTGLGLSTVYGIIKQSGGYVYVASKEGEGTNFSLFFPMVQPGENQDSDGEGEVAEKAASVDLTGKGTILLVEDETPVRLFAARALRNKGYTILEADCAETAISIMEEQGKEVEVIVTDVIMPGMNGPTMIDQVTENHPDVKVIFISGYAEDIFVNNYGTERSFNFLAKPFTLKQLASKIKEVAG